MEKKHNLIDDHFMQKDGQTFAGKHLIIDIWQAQNLDDEALIKQFLHNSVLACGATLLHIHTHVFTPYKGVSGVAVLAESHISLHTWPERGFGAFDVFMCGQNTNPHALVDCIKQSFAPGEVKLSSMRRGVVDADNQ